MYEVQRSVALNVVLQGRLESLNVLSMTQLIAFLMQHIRNFIPGTREWHIAWFWMWCYTTRAIKRGIERYTTFLSLPLSIILKYEMSYFYYNILTILFI
jgi:hypothetical protein